MKWAARQRATNGGPRPQGRSGEPAHGDLPLSLAASWNLSIN